MTGRTHCAATDGIEILVGMQRLSAAVELHRYTAQFLVQTIHFSYWWDAIVNNFRDHLLEQSNERVVQGRPCIHS